MNTNEQVTPKVLFKYRDDSERTEDIVKKRKIWLSAPHQLNVPLECLIGEIPKDWELETIRQMEEGQLMGMYGVPGKPTKEFLSLNTVETKKWFKHLSKLTHEKRVMKMRKIYADHGITLSKPKDIFINMRKNISSVGIFSLSENPCNELMWSHYAASHKGIALGFSSDSNSKLSDSRHCLPVTYSAEKPTFSAGFISEIQFLANGTNIQRVSFSDKVFRSAISTKSPSWEYEKEWRYVEEESGLFDYPGNLIYVVFGMKMSEERRSYYKELITKYISDNIKFFEICLSSCLSTIEIKRIQ